MAQETLEARVARLELQMSLIVGGQADQPAADDWKQTVGMFQGDPIVHEMIEHAREMREEDRRRARQEGEMGPA